MRLAASSGYGYPQDKQKTAELGDMRIEHMKNSPRTTAFVAACMASSALVAPAIAQDVSTLASESGGLSSWGLPNTAAYGQTFTVANATRLDTVTFRIRDNVGIGYDLQVFAWDPTARRVTGSSLGSTSGTTPGTGSEEIATLAAGSNAVGRLVIVNSAGLARNRGQDSLTTRDETLSFTRVADPETGAFTVTQSTMDSAQMMGGIYTWVDLTGFRADDDDNNRAYSGRGLQIGADMEVMPDMVVGLSLGVEDLNATVGAVNQDGVLRYLQPYLAYRSGAWSGEATLLYGLGDYTQTSGGGTGEGETRLAAITFNGGYDYALDQGVTLTPMLGLAHGVERIEGVSGTLAGAGTETVRFTQASLGAEISQSTGTGEIFAGFHADWLNTDTDTVLVQDLLVDDGWTGRLELGLSTEVGSGITLDTTVALSGLGGDLQSTSGSLRFAFRF
jgi:hypothetical protein